MKKLSSLLLVMLMVISAVSVGMTAYAQTEDDFPCGGVVEELDVEIFYSPILNRIAFSGCPSIAGTVLKIAYYDDETEFVTVEKTDDGYRAGDFKVVFPTGTWNEVNIIEYGFVCRELYLTKGEDSLWHSYGYAEFKFLNLPSVSEILSLSFLK